MVEDEKRVKRVFVCVCVYFGVSTIEIFYFSSILNLEKCCTREDIL